MPAAPPGGWGAALAAGTSADLPPPYLTGDARAALARRERRRGRWLLLGGVVAVAAAVGITLRVTAGDDGSEPAAPREHGPAQTVAGIAVGACFTGRPSDVTTVDCARPHDGELFGQVAGPAVDAWPGEPALQRDMGNACMVALAGYTGAGPAEVLARGIAFRPVTPTRVQWDGGATGSYCVAYPATGGTLTGSIKD